MFQTFHKHLIQFSVCLIIGIGVVACSDSNDSEPTLVIIIDDEAPTLVPTATPNAHSTSVMAPTSPPLDTPPPSDNQLAPTVTPVPIQTATPIPNDANPPEPIPNGQTHNAEVAEGRGGLRIRDLPSTNGQILQNLDELTPLNAYGRTPDSFWLAVEAPTTSGWVIRDFITLFVDVESLPIIEVDLTTLPDAPPVNPEVAANNPPTAPDPADNLTNVRPPSTDSDGLYVGSNGVVMAEGTGVRLRQQPSTNAQILGRLPENDRVQILGRNEDGTWLNVNSSQGTGWVYASYIQSGVDINALTVPDEAYIATPSSFEVPTVRAAEGVVSNITSNAAQIFMTGRSYGNRSNVFSKVGDSITATGHFLYPFGWGNYDLHGYAYFDEVIGFFSTATARESNSFSNGSMAAEPYWNSATVLDPSSSKGDPCLSGEMPLVCEYRVVRPAVSLIMIGTNDIGQHSAEQFQANLQRIVEISIQMGVIPVLSTIPPKVGWDDEVFTFNQIIIATAQGYDVPLWDFYTAMLALPNQGLDGDGVHPSWKGAEYQDYAPSADFTDENLEYGFALRNLTALQLLDAIWRQVIAPNDDQPVTVIGNNTAGLSNTSQSGIPSAAASVDVALPPSVAGDGGNNSTCTIAMPPRLQVGASARVTPGPANNLRETPDTNAAIIAEIPGGGVFKVLDGPRCAGGMAYWQVQYNGIVGWTAEGRDGAYWLEPL